MNTIVYNDDNWLFPNQPLKTHDISYDDIQYLLNCADIDDRRAFCGERSAGGSWYL